jgi:hypothetical protein
MKLFMQTAVNEPQEASGPLFQVPQTIADAMTFCICLGLPYLD